MLTRFISVPGTKQGRGGGCHALAGGRRSWLTWERPVNVLTIRQRPSSCVGPVSLTCSSPRPSSRPPRPFRPQAGTRPGSRVVWHSNRHTLASRLAMAGVDSLALKELRGWKSLSMIQRYAHCVPGRRQPAVERLVAPPPASDPELARNEPVRSQCQRPRRCSRGRSCLTSRYHRAGAWCAQEDSNLRPSDS
jgi:hypothetical protein